ncbi:DUF6308 family protein [Verrucosispora sp. WMMA2044]|uniref:DUF6308 family protein n=1 Tax=Verrucosispora sp. WMMA2044 TaxID=3016419 RepID=UPI00248AB9A4|nr:DUF6308 family protein [Verrucosispora sp. WMMA2044]WBB47432.1 DUF6308 family protein [Verrucosispora sp. WMMA2044]
MIVIACAAEPDPLRRVVDYVKQRGRTIRQYDLTGEGDPDLLTLEDVVRTRIIRSRISNEERDWLVARAAEGQELWSVVAPDARLADADPAEVGLLYDRALALFKHFHDQRPSGLATGKISKVLHLKRRGLFPILDSQLADRYRRKAADCARRHRADRPGLRLAYWIAIRGDLVDPTNVAGLWRLREDLASHQDELVRRAAHLTDLRLLDILTWR